MIIYLAHKANRFVNSAMLFSSLIFLYLFLPLTLAFCFSVPAAWRNALLLIASLIFYAWGGVSYSLIMLFSICFNYTMARLVDSYGGNKKSKLFLGLCISGNLLLLGIMKYSGFVVENLNVLLQALHVKKIQMEPVNLPAGISFFTFHAISYVVDIYRKECPVQKNPVRLALYISFFPQLIAGPIIRYHDIASQLERRKLSIGDFTCGAERFILGLAKKVLISNVFAWPATEIFKTPVAELNGPLAWFGAFSYAMHIYCDFSGYSDMALGLGRMFGFHFPENFNFPYIATSIREFWRRWHISLSTWFRDYVYVPLGGNRKGTARTYLNLMLIFFLTGLWHGANWNFVIWGFIHGFFLVTERLFLGRLLDRLPGLKLIYTLFIVLNAWVFFNATDLSYALDYLRRMYGMLPPGNVTKDISFYTNAEILFVSILGILGAGGFFSWLQRRTPQWSGVKLRLMFQGFRYAALLVMLYVCTVYLLCNSYNPFIYFRF
jgi:alginate O-acetyltransferase complex protein AlgI